MRKMDMKIDDNIENRQGKRTNYTLQFKSDLTKR
jgi:hypothetical protein